MKKLLQTITVASIAAFTFSAPAFAEEAGGIPSLRECKDGYKEGMQWTREEFREACIKVRTNAVPAGQTK